MLLKRIFSFFSNTSILIIGLCVPLFLLFTSILSSPWSGDDIFNKDYKSAAVLDGRNLLSLILEHNNSWATDAGRFFPSSITWTLSIFWVVQDRLTYKFIIGLIVILTILIFSVTVYLISKNKQLFFLTVFFSTGVLQFRVGNDGLIGFTGLIPITVTLACLSLITSIGPGRWWRFILGFLFFFLALTTYETVILFVPLFLLIIWKKTKSVVALLPILTASFVTLGIVIFLRLQIPATSLPPAYSVSLNPEKIAETTLKQFFGAIPFSQWLFDAPDRPTIRIGLLVLVLIVVLFSTFPAIFITTKEIRPTLDGRRATLAIGASLWIWLSSALIIGLTKRWQDELQWGQAYLGVIFEYFALALLLASVYSYFSGKFVFIGSRKYLNFAYLGMSFLLSSAIAGTIAANFSLIPIQ